MSPRRFLVCLSLALAAGLPCTRGDTVASPPATAAPSSPVLPIDFGLLGGFEFTPPETVDEDAVANETTWGGDQVPAAIKKLSGRKIVIAGYMMPLKWKKDRVVEFLVLSNTMACCYGATPKLNEVIVVKSKQGVEATLDAPVFFHGTLSVAPVVEDGYLSAIYAMECERVSL